jgi:hypothetical protein
VGRLKTRNQRLKIADFFVQKTESQRLNEAVSDLEYFSVDPCRQLMTFDEWFIMASEGQTDIEASSSGATETAIKLFRQIEANNDRRFLDFSSVSECSTGLICVIDFGAVALP